MPRVFVHSPDHEHVRHTRLTGTRSDRVAVVVELGHVDVAVGVDQAILRVFKASMRWAARSR